MVICDEVAKFRLQEIHTPTFGDWIRQPHLNTTLQKVRIQAGTENVLKLSDCE